MPLIVGGKREALGDILRISGTTHFPTGEGKVNSLTAFVFYPGGKFNFFANVKMTAGGVLIDGTGAGGVFGKEN